MNNDSARKLLHELTDFHDKMKRGWPWEYQNIDPAVIAELRRILNRYGGTIPEPKTETVPLPNHLTPAMELLSDSFMGDPITLSTPPPSLDDKKYYTYEPPPKQEYEGDTQQ